MRESFGAAGIFIIVVTFIVLFTVYLSVSVNYAKAFKLKNHIISIIEENNGYDSNAENQIQNYLVAQRYTAHGDAGNPNGWTMAGCVGQNPVNSTDCMATVFVAVTNIDPNKRDDNNNQTCYPRTYYKVVTYFNFVLPILNVNIPFKVSGDTSTIYNYDQKTYSNVECISVD